MVHMTERAKAFGTVGMGYVCALPSGFFPMVAKQMPMQLGKYTCLFTSRERTGATYCSLLKVRAVTSEKLRSSLISMARIEALGYSPILNKSVARGMVSGIEVFA